ncbi:MAG: DoxX family protein [Myxococcota bacterium]|nr:DoxX family protein [Myxococcota bacterium]
MNAKAENTQSLSMESGYVKAKAIGYWVTTVLTALLIGSGGIMQVLRTPDAVDGIVRLGFPVYFVVLLGIWKTLGAAAILAPRLPRLKEWAYAGIVFDLTGAAVSHAASGSAAGNVVGPALFTLLALASWALRPDSRTVGKLFSA